jgi:hypothetical protein
MTASNRRSCATVSAGAFFPQADFQVPQKKMREHRQEYMVVPARVLPPFIVVHPQRGFAFFKTLFNGLITNDKFCCTRWERLSLSWRRGHLRLRV